MTTKPVGTHGWVIALAVSLLLFAYAFAQMLFLAPVISIEWYSVFSEGVVLLLVLGGLFRLHDLVVEPHIYRPLITGFSILLLSLVTDFLDEFLNQPAIITTLFEDFAEIAGFFFIIFGLWRWHDFNNRITEALKQAANTDSLTTALNRRGFELRLDEEVARASRYDYPLALISFDLDEFKAINDRHGHAHGDKVLRNTVRVIKNAIRNVDILARTGGEEFCILMPQTTLEQAGEVAEALRQELSTAHWGDDVYVTASFGVCLYEPGESHDALLQRVDTALYQAKREGRNRVYVSGAGSA